MNREKNQPGEIQLSFDHVKTSDIFDEVSVLTALSATLAGVIESGSSEVFQTGDSIVSARETEGLAGQIVKNLDAIQQLLAELHRRSRLAP
jgi:hypothetical protein